MTADFDPDLTQALKEEVLHRERGTSPSEADIIQSWRRSQAALGDPGSVSEVPHVPESLLDEHLLDMFGAPMNRFAEDLEGTGLALLLADSRGQILQRWCEDRQSRSHLDGVGTVRGAVLAENVVGTNGVGTVVATGSAVQIRGSEHFAEIYQDAVCTGAPVLHPITRKLLAVVTLSCDLTPRTDLLKPLVKSMTAQLEQHVLSVEHPDTRRMFNVFLDRARKRTMPIVGFGPQGVMIQSEQANALTPHDIAVLRDLSEESRESGRYVVELSTGPTALDITAVGRGNNVVVVGDVQSRPARAGSPPARPPVLAGRSPEWLAVVNNVERLQSLPDPVIVAGEVGVGKTSLALGAPFRAGVVPARTLLVDAAERHIVGSREWLMALRDAMATDQRVVVRGIETLDAPALDGMRAIIESRPAGAATTMTLTTESRDDVEAVELKFGARSVWVPPLRDRVADLPELLASMGSVAAPGARLDVKPEAMRLLESYAWPGNVKELRQLVLQLVAARTGAVEAADLPAAMQATKNLTLIERVELEAIRKALQEAKGNRVKAADILGVSRATVYRKMKAYRLG